MPRFAYTKYKAFTLSFSLFLILAGYVKTFAVHGGFANSLDFNGGLRLVIELPIGKGRPEIESFFLENKIEAVTLLLEKQKNIYQVDIGLGSIPKIEELFNSKSPGDKGASTIDRLVSLVVQHFQIPREKVLSADQVGAVVGGELTETGITLLISTLLIILGYLSYRSAFKFALASAIALVHDILFTLAMIGFFQIKPSVPIIAALLTLLGYSINDKIVVFDRIRENAHGKDNLSLSNIINISISQTLGRTINTSITTLISIIAIVIGGAIELYDFAYVLIFGVVVGTYSSIFIAAPIALIYDDWRRKSA